MNRIEQYLTRVFLRFDSGNQEPLSERILTLCKGIFYHLQNLQKKFRLIYLKKSSSQYFLFVCSVHLTSRDKSRDAASYLASKFLTRPDTRDTSLPAFLDWALVTATKGNIRSKLISGIRMIDLITLIDWEIKVFLIEY